MKIITDVMGKGNSWRIFSAFSQHFGDETHETTLEECSNLILAFGKVDDRVVDAFFHGDNHLVRAEVTLDAAQKAVVDRLGQHGKGLHQFRQVIDEEPKEGVDFLLDGRRDDFLKLAKSAKQIRVTAILG